MVRRRMLKSKIHRATVTGADVDYVGSVSIDRRLMEQADILPWEQVVVADVDNGARLETYAIPGEDGEVRINGAAARLVDAGHRVILITYVDVDEEDVAGFEPTIVLVDGANRPVAPEPIAVPEPVVAHSGE